MPDSSGIGTRSTRCMPKTPIRSFLSCIIRMHGCPHYYGAHTLEYSTKPYALPEAMSSDSASSMGLVRSASLNGHVIEFLPPVGRATTGYMCLSWKTMGQRVPMALNGFRFAMKPNVWMHSYAVKLTVYMGHRLTV